MADEEMADLHADLASYKREIDRLNGEVASAYRKLHAALSGGYDRGLRLRTAWASARMGRAKARKEAADLRTTLTLVGQSLSLVGERAEQAEAERDRLDVRIDEISAGFVKVSHLHPSSEDGNLCATCKRPYPCPTVKALIGIDDHASEVIAERDQIKAANDRVKALATDAARTGCGAGWDLNPAEVLAALQPADSKET